MGDRTHNRSKRRYCQQCGNRPSPADAPCPADVSPSNSPVKTEQRQTTDRPHAPGSIPSPACEAGNIGRIMGTGNNRGRGRQLELFSVPDVEAAAPRYVSSNQAAVAPRPAGGSIKPGAADSATTGETMNIGAATSQNREHRTTPPLPPPDARQQRPPPATKPLRDRLLCASLLLVPSLVTIALDRSAWEVVGVFGATAPACVAVLRDAPFSPLKEQSAGPDPEEG